MKYYESFSARIMLRRFLRIKMVNLELFKRLSKNQLAGLTESG